MNGVRVAGVAVGLAAIAAMTACGESEAAEAQPTAPPVTASPTAPPVTASPTAPPVTASPTAPDVAAQLKVPDGNRPVSSMEAAGVQVYECADGAWRLLEPAATLTENGKTAALHAQGPLWVSTVDGSAVTAAPVDGASATRPNAVPELLLKATAARGTGVFAQVSYVQRLRTEGGVAPGKPCTGGEQEAVPYTAVYTFYAPAR